MHEYWKKVHDEALAGMRRVTGQEVEDTLADMKRGWEYAKKHGTFKQASDAADYYIDYKWVCHEKAAHAASNPATASRAM